MATLISEKRTSAWPRPASDVYLASVGLEARSRRRPTVRLLVMGARAGRKWELRVRHADPLAMAHVLMDVVMNTFDAVPMAMIRSVCELSGAELIAVHRNRAVAMPVWRRSSSVPLAMLRGHEIPKPIAGRLTFGSEP